MISSLEIHSTDDFEDIYKSIYKLSVQYGDKEISNFLKDNQKNSSFKFYFVSFFLDSLEKIFQDEFNKKVFHDFLSDKEGWPSKDRKNILKSYLFKKLNLKGKLAFQFMLDKILNLKSKKLLNVVRSFEEQNSIRVDATKNEKSLFKDLSNFNLRPKI